MAAATQPIPALLTLEEYMHTVYHPDCEFVDGYLEERNMGEPKHGLIQMQLGFWFLTHPEWNLRAISELRTRVHASRIRIPDVTIVEDNDSLMEYPRKTPPFIAIEILSPDDRLPRVIVRLKEFLAMGVQHIWLLDPIDQVAYTYTASGLDLIEATRIEIPQSPVFLDVAEIFSCLQPRSKSEK